MNQYQRFPANGTHTTDVSATKFPGALTDPSYNAYFALLPPPDPKPWWKPRILRSLTRRSTYIRVAVIAAPRFPMIPPESLS